MTTSRRCRYLNGSSDESLIAARDEYRTKAPTLAPDLAADLLAVADDIDGHLAWRTEMREAGVL